MSKLDLSKPVKTKICGSPVDILFTLKGGEYVAIGYRVRLNGGVSTRIDWRDHLENIPQKRSGWVRLKHSFATIYEKKESIERDLKPGEVAAYIEWEE